MSFLFPPHDSLPTCQFSFPFGTANDAKNRKLLLTVSPCRALPLTVASAPAAYAVGLGLHRIGQKAGQVLWLVLLTFCCMEADTGSGVVTSSVGVF